MHHLNARIGAAGGARFWVHAPRNCFISVADPKGLRHGCGIAAVTAGVPLSTIAAVLGHADLATTATYTTAVGVEAREFLAKMWG